MKKILLVLCIIPFIGSAQELYVFTEPASNMPAHSLSVKQSFKTLRNNSRAENRHTTELMLGVSKNWMVHAATTFSNMYSVNTRWESARLYAKYRFLSDDNMFSHFRMAAFAEGAYSRNRAMYDELALEGDQSGVQFGIIATQLLHKLALSATVSHTQTLGEARELTALGTKTPYSAFSYSLSAGYLILPKKYKDYRQTNVNLYVELLGQQATDVKKYYVDLAPAAQFIFGSAVKLNAGYRFQLGSDMTRMFDKSFLFGFEWLFLNALRF